MATRASNIAKAFDRRLYMRLKWLPERLTSKKPAFIGAGEGPKKTKIHVMFIFFAFL